MRTETYFASAALVRDLEQSGAIAHVHHDGGDIIHVELTTGEHAWIHLIESSIPQAEIIGTLDANGEKELFTLFLFWADRLLPAHNHTARIEEWMRPLLALHGDRLYGYEVHGRDIYIFPVYFEGRGDVRRIRYGKMIEATRLLCRRHHLKTPELNGIYLGVDFTDRPAEAREAPRAAPHPLERDYAALGLSVTSDRRAIKRAYRRLAREHHPDVSSDPLATARMQALNESYRRIVRALEAEDSTASRT